VVTVLYVDTSALVTAYLQDEPEHGKFRELLLEGADPIMSSDFTRIEFAGAMTAAKRIGRIPDPAAVLAHFDHLASPDGDLVLIPFDPGRVIPAARRLVTENYPVRTLDAIHIAVAVVNPSPSSPATSGRPMPPRPTGSRCCERRPLRRQRRARDHLPRPRGKRDRRRRPSRVVWCRSWLHEPHGPVGSPGGPRRACCPVMGNR
jgi:predicted nucleic acid-binding protein